MKKSLLRISLFVFLSAFLLLPLFTLAANFQDASDFYQKTGQTIGYDTGSTYVTEIAKLIRLALSAVGAIFVLLIIYGGFLWMTADAGADKNKLEKAKKIFKYAIIGLVIITFAYALSYFVTFAVEQGAQTQTEIIQ